MKKKRSFFEKLTGTSRLDNFDDDIQDEDFDIQNNYIDDEAESQNNHSSNIMKPTGGELSVDVLNNENEIIIKAMVAGVKPQDLDVQISRDVVTIEGTREEDHEVNDTDYYHRELYWGSFSRNILLPEEIDVELAEAREKHGLLEIRLPKIDKTRKAKLHVKSS